METYFFFSISQKKERLTSLKLHQGEVKKKKNHIWMNYPFKYLERPIVSVFKYLAGDFEIKVKLCFLQNNTMPHLDVSKSTHTHI